MRSTLATSVVSVLGSYSLAILPKARRELSYWERRAAAIPDPSLRRDALDALATKSGNAEGAAAFAALVPRVARARTVELLVALETLYDYVDTLAERPARDVLANSRLLHMAMLDALDPRSPDRDYYESHSASDDGGYLREHVHACRAAVAELPSHSAVRSLLLHRAHVAREVQSLNHAGLYGSHQDLARWASSLADERCGFRWWELAAAALSPLTILALLATAADPETTAEDARAVDAAYFPWVAGLNGLLESLVDVVDDQLTGNHSTFGRYASPEGAAERMSTIAAGCLERTRSLPHGGTHAAVIASMIAYYAVDPHASLPATRPATDAMLAAVGGLAVAPLALFRAKGAARSLKRIFAPAGCPLRSSRLREGGGGIGRPSLVGVLSARTPES